MCEDNYGGMRVSSCFEKDVSKWWHLGARSFGCICRQLVVDWRAGLSV